MPDITERRVVYALPRMGEARHESGIAYKRVGETELKLDVYAPPALQPGERRPAILFVHGEPWTREPAAIDARAMGQYRSWGELAAASGWIGIPFEHRISRACTRLPDVASDLDDLIAFARTRLPQVDGDRLVLWTCSGGGAYGLRAAMLHHPAAIRCAVAYYAFLEPLARRAEIPPEVPDEVLREFSPITHLARRDPQLPPTLLVRAGLDHPALNATIDRFAAEALRWNAPVEVLNYPEGHHAFDVLDDTEQARYLIARTLAFIRLHTADAP